MHQLYTIVFLLLSLCTRSTKVLAQTKFTATATPSNIGKTEYFTYKLAITNGNTINALNPPSLKDFNIISGPDQMIEGNTINNVSIQIISFQYTLQPKKPGNFTIQPATATIDGKNYKTNSVNITVSNKKTLNNNSNANNVQNIQSLFDDAFSPQPVAEPYKDYILKKNETIPDKIKRNLQFKLETNKTSCYVGEPIVATYNIYTRLRTETSLTKNPSFNGFSVIDMLRQNEPNPQSKGSINGRPCDVYTLRKAQLYPLQAGAIELEPATIDNNISFVKAENEQDVNPYNIASTDVVNERITINTNPITINVKALPELGKPANFNGAVGDFNIETTVEKNTFSTDEAGKLIITINGTGNMQLLTSPTINWPTGIEAFEPTVVDNINNETIPLSGSKTFEIPFSVNASGSYILPEVFFSYFNPSTAQYKTVSSKPITINISKGDGKQLKNALAQQQTVQQPGWWNYIFSHRWIIVLIVACIIIIGIIIWFLKDAQQQKKAPAIKPNIIVNETVTETSKPILNIEQAFAKTYQCLERPDCVDFYVLLQMELKQFLATQLQLEPHQLNTKHIIAVMDQKGVSNQLTLETQSLLNEIEQQLYTPFERSDALQQMYVRAQTLVQQIAKHFV
ncbi:BatD family protein [Ferruginibacter yonginensis]|uniref:BatD family protein n=1 Tax=Ferruginibacter yonginensis TaxID=1310416 RepID=A0ABV8QWJ6_9BACT